MPPYTDALTEMTSNNLKCAKFCPKCFIIFLPAYQGRWPESRARETGTLGLDPLKITTYNKYTLIEQSPQVL